MSRCNCPEFKPDIYAKSTAAERQISMDCPIHGEPTHQQLTARITALEAERDRLREALESLDNLTARDAAIVTAALAGGE